MVFLKDNAMIKKALFLISLFLAPSVYAEDLGVHGHLYTIDEPDLLEVIASRLQAFEKSGRLQDRQRSMLESTQKTLQRPKAVSSITPATQKRQWTFDPSIHLNQDLKDHQGHIFYPKGTRLNPLSLRPMTQTLLFMDGDDLDHIAFAKTHSAHHRTLWILVKGSPLDLQKHLASTQDTRSIYFDQEGHLTKKLGIRHVPCWVRQEGPVLLLEEIPLKEGSLKKDSFPKDLPRGAQTSPSLLTHKKG